MHVRWSALAPPVLCLLWVSAALGADAGPRVADLEGAPKGSAKFWLESSLKRVFPNTKPGSASLSLIAPRNGRVAFQVAVRNDNSAMLFNDVQIVGADDLTPRVRFVGLVPVHHPTPGTDPAQLDGLENIPGLVPDPLWPMSSAHFGPFQSRSFWVTINVPADAKPSARTLTVRVAASSGAAGAKTTVVEMPVTLEISELVVQPRKNFPVTHWWRGEATWDHYKTGMFEDERWWQITRAQLENMLDHGSDVVYVPLFFNRRETFKRPCQLLIVNVASGGKYDFDWSRTKRFTDMCREIGFTKFEWPHLWIYWGVKNPMRIYTEREPGKHEMLWPPDISGFSDTYLNFLRQFLPEFKAFLDREKLLDGSYFHLSDEPSAEHVADYRKAREILKELAPWMKTMDALSDISYAGVTDIPVPIVNAAQPYIDAKVPHWVYFCCAPTGPWLNRFMDTPLAKIRMSGWTFYRLGAQGFLHWGFNYWHKLEREELVDPFNDSSAALYPSIPYGDPFMIYPGGDGKPMDSIRWEVFAESLQDYAILQTAGIAPGNAVLADIKSYADFPKSEEWIKQTMTKVLRGDVAAAAAAAE